MLGKLKYEHIQYIICVYLNFWMSLFVMTGISYLSSSLEDVAFSISLLLKTIKILHLSRFFSLMHCFTLPTFFLFVRKKIEIVWKLFFQLLDCVWMCCSPNLGLATKARTCKGVDQEWIMGIPFHVPRCVGECEGMNLHTLKWASTLGVRVLMDSQIFRKQLQGLKPIRLIFFYINGKLSHDPFEYLKHKLWPKKRLGVKIVNLIPDHKKSRIISISLCVDGVPHIVEKFSTRARTLFLTSPQLKVYTQKVQKYIKQFWAHFCKS